MAVLLGTVAIEPHRWGARPDRPPTVLAEWLDDIASAGFDGIELWEGHLLNTSAGDAAAILEHRLPVVVYNSYAPLDAGGDAQRAAAAGWATRCGAQAVKFNVGADRGQEDGYAERIRHWLGLLPGDVTLLCECHTGTIAEDPATAARLLSAAGAAGRVGAIVHTHESPERVRARFAAYGERIAHVHVNFLRRGGGAPHLRAMRERLTSFVGLVGSLGFRGTWTVEFVHGVGSAADHPRALLASAREDLRVLRDVLGEP